MLLWSRCGSRSREVGHFVGIEDGKRSLGEIRNDGVTASVGRDGGEVESSRLGFRILLLALFGHPADCQAEAMLVCREELVATVWQLVCVPFLAASHANFGLSGRGTIIFATFTNQCDNIASLLILLGLL